MIQVNLNKKTPGHGQHGLILTSATTRRPTFIGSLQEITELELRMVLWMQRHHSRLKFGLFGRGLR